MLFLIIRTILLFPDSVFTISNKDYLNDDTVNGHTPIYLNEFAVYIPNGYSIATLVAEKYGFINSGQVRVYLF